jgi:hypothetical protein
VPRSPGTRQPRKQVRAWLEKTFLPGLLVIAGTVTTAAARAVFAATRAVFTATTARAVTAATGRMHVR